MARPGPPKVYRSQLNVPIETSVKDRLRLMAETHDTTVSALVRSLLRSTFTEEESWAREPSN
jgi:plasmid stability protein